jgi:hypothetical protein
MTARNPFGFQNVQQVLDLFCGDSWPNIDGHRSEVRPPSAPTAGRRDGPGWRTMDATCGPIRDFAEGREGSTHDSQRSDGQPHIFERVMTAAMGDPSARR